MAYRKGSSERNSLHNKDYSFEEGVKAYTETILSQKNIIAITPHDNQLIAFMSFIHNYERLDYFPQDPKEDDIVNYITTLIVHPEHRRKGIGNFLYDYIENDLPEQMHANCVAVRTWDINHGHIELLKKRGYSLTCTLHQERVVERDYGNEMHDTVYFCKRVNRKQTTLHITQH